MLFRRNTKENDKADVPDTTTTAITPETTSTSASAKTSLEDTQSVTAATNGSPKPPGSAGKDAQAVVAQDGQNISDTSKLKTFLMILKRFIGVTDIAAVRFSLPAQLLEPIPNLEYWHYLDRPETFAAIGDSDDPLERTLACLRFWFTKDLKYVKGKPCKPYNSSLGEFFRCSWEIEEPAAGKKEGDAAAANGQLGKPLKVHYITEQTSHHPPISAFVYDCPEKGIEATGYDQLSAKFTGTSVRVTPGQYNRGIFIRLKNRDNEEYHLTHPAAYLGGFLRGNLYVSVADVCFVSCEKTGYKTILQYHEEGYFGKTQNKVEGVVYRPDDFAADPVSKLKDVPKEQIVGRIEGVWTEQIWYTPGNTEFKKVPEADRILLMDVTPLVPVPKKCPPMDQQLPNESRKFWDEVTKAITAKQFAQATNKKQALEERQRERATERQQQGKEWRPRFFSTVTEKDGRAVLNEEGRKLIEGMQSEQYHLEKPAEYGAL
jgi:hypothetical protein